MSKTVTAENEERFAFGKNRKKFLSDLDDAAIEVAKASLAKMLGRDDLTGMTFLDVGSGSGLPPFRWEP
mgnify:CR=1 FL=1|tara:strand:+ start:151 stop:357 length:207 start_codon:yes stop_codon:yes gene_type:complete